jgi:hypothetical protein
MNGNRYAGKKRVRNQHCQVRHEGRTAMSGQRRLPPAPPGPALRLRAAAGVAAVTMLAAAAGCGTGTGSAAAPATASPPGAVVVNCVARSLCYAPRQFRVAYGIQPLLDRGITGRGQTVVLLEFPPAAGSPPAVTDIRQDLARFDSGARTFHRIRPKNPSALRATGSTTPATTSAQARDTDSKRGTASTAHRNYGTGRKPPRRGITPASPARPTARRHSRRGTADTTMAPSLGTRP